MTIKPKNPDTATRCKLIRIVLDGNGRGSIRRFSGRIDIQENRWSMAEAGYPLGLALATILVQKIHGLDFNYLFSGRTDGLSRAMFDRLDEAERSYKKPSSK